jgi:ABC-type phosphate transport system substrate-binding protein
MTVKSYSRKWLVAVWCGLAWLGVAEAPALAQISVVMSKSTPAKVTKAEIKEIFTGAKLKWANGNKIQVIDQPDTALGKEFYAAVVGKSINQVRAQWTKLLLSGQAVAPLKYASDKTIKKAVAANPHAIGYIMTGALDDSVQEVFRLELKN